MALELLQPNVQPYGQFDGYDAIVFNVKGGEVATFASVVIGTDIAAWDANGTDGYFGTTTKSRTVVTTNLATGARPLFLVDDGLVGYGTLLGSVIGGVAGQQVYPNFAGGPGTQFGQLLGPHTATGSGKLTLWDGPGMYAVTLDAVDATAGTGLVPSNASLASGSALYATAAGLLTPDSSKSFETSPAAKRVGSFVSFESYKGGSLVTTPVFLVSAANSPVGIGQPQAQYMTRAVFHFNPYG